MTWTEDWTLPGWGPVPPLLLDPAVLLKTEKVDVLKAVFALASPGF